MRLIACPLPGYDGLEGDKPRYFVVLPDVWLGRHSRKRDEVVEKANGKFGNGDLLKFAISMAFLEDWSLPNLPNNPEHWDFDGLDFRVIAWVNTVAFGDFAACYSIEKKFSPPSTNGSMTKGTTKQPGSLEVS